MAEARYDVGDVGRANGTFETEGGAAQDPDNLSFEVQSPSGVETTFVYGVDEEVERINIGEYRVDVPLTEPGIWRYRWVATGDGQTAEPGSFEVFANPLATAADGLRFDTLARVSERVECDLSEPELVRLIAEAFDEIDARHGPPADPLTPITVALDGYKRTLDLTRPLDTAEAVVVTEYSYAEDATVLAADDYRISNGGRTLRRLSTGTNPRLMGWDARAEVEYVPVNDGNKRQEVVIKLVQLAVEYAGVIERTVGDVKTVHGQRTATDGTSPLVYADERERLLSSLAPRPGIFLR